MENAAFARGRRPFSAHLPGGGQPMGPKAAGALLSGAVMKLTAPPTTSAHPHRPPQLAFPRRKDLGKTFQDHPALGSGKRPLRLQGPRAGATQRGSPS